MTTALTERVLDIWERGAGLDIHDRSDLLLDLAGWPAGSGSTGCLYERDQDLIELRRTLFGPSIDGVTRCPACGTNFEMALDLAVLRGPTPSPEPVTVERDGFVAVVRPPQSSDLRELEPDLASAGADLFERCVVEARRGSETIAAWELPPGIREAAADAISLHGMEGPSLDLACGECAHAWCAPVDIARMLLADVDGWAGRLLADVHRIAAAYHWDERDIIALPARRRQYYLEAIG